MNRTRRQYSEVVIIFALAGGLLGLVASIALRRNTARARSWETREGLVDSRFVYMSLPGFSLVLLGFGALGILMPLADSPAGVIGCILSGAVALLGVGLSAWGLFATTIPQWLLPRWKRD